MKSEPVRFKLEKMINTASNLILTKGNHQKKYNRPEIWKENMPRRWYKKKHVQSSDHKLKSQETKSINWVITLKTTQQSKRSKIHLIEEREQNEDHFRINQVSNNTNWWIDARASYHHCPNSYYDYDDNNNNNTVNFII